MIYPNYIYTSNCDLWLDTLQQTSVMRQSNVVEYTSQSGVLKQQDMSNAAARRSLSATITGSNVLTVERYMDALLGESALLCLGARQLATYTRILDYNVPTINSTVQPVQLNVVYEGAVAGQFREAEDTTISGSTVSDANASMGSAVILDARYEKVYFTLDQDDIFLPEGDYRLFVRWRASAGLSGDQEMYVYNNSDYAMIASSNPVSGTSYEIDTLDFTIDSADAGDTIKFVAGKLTTGVQDIHVDFLGFVAVP